MDKNVFEFHSEVIIHQGHHSLETQNLIQDAWKNQKCLILCPAHVKDTQFIKDLKIPKNIILGIFTSGTMSGKPRLVFYTKKNIESSLRSIRELFETEKIDQIFCYPQPTHTFGLTLGYIHAIHHNLKLTFHEGAYSSDAHRKWFSVQTPGLLTLGTPTHFIDLIGWLKTNNLTPKKSYSAILGGAPVAKQLWQQLVDILKIEKPSVGYGATEASPGITHLAPGAEPKCDGAIGKLLTGVTLEPVESGGFIFSGDNVCEAIADETGLHFQKRIHIKDDLSKTATDSYIFNVRADLIINRGGLKISPELIESQLLTEFNLKSICIPFYSERLGEDIGLVVQANEIDKNELSERIINFVATKASVKISSEHIIFSEIPVNLNSKYDRKEALKIILRKKNLTKPISIQYLKTFMPHRSTAVWISRITDFGFRRGTAEIDLDVNSPLFSNSQMRESACIELVAQAYGYSVAAHEIFSEDNEILKVQKTLIAEVRKAEFHFDEKTHKLIKEMIEEKIPLAIDTVCTHDFGLIKVITGNVKAKDLTIASLNLKAFVL
jgi:predicted hotdog family 3-hydroxylacyl-ACP dehydratase